MPIALFELIDSFAYEKNVKVSALEFIEKFINYSSSFFMLSSIYPKRLENILFCGFPVVFAGDTAIIFVRCEWCGARDHALDSNNFCAHCGGYLDGKQWLT